MTLTQRLATATFLAVVGLSWGLGESRADAQYFGKGFSYNRFDRGFGYPSQTRFNVGGFPRSSFDLNFSVRRGPVFYGNRGFYGSRFSTGFVRPNYFYGGRYFCY